MHLRAQVFKIRTNIGKLCWRKAKFAIRWVFAWGARVVMAAPVCALLNGQIFVCILIMITCYGKFLWTVLLNLFLNYARPSNASATSKSTKSGNEGRKHLGESMIMRIFKTAPHHLQVSGCCYLRGVSPGTISETFPDCPCLHYYSCHRRHLMRVYTKVKVSAATR